MKRCAAHTPPPALLGVYLCAKSTCFVAKHQGGPADSPQLLLMLLPVPLFLMHVFCCRLTAVDDARGVGEPLNKTLYGTPAPPR
jgi:hypothetical protein